MLSRPRERRRGKDWGAGGSKALLQLLAVRSLLLLRGLRLSCHVVWVQTKVSNYRRTRRAGRAVTGPRSRLPG